MIKTFSRDEKKALIALIKFIISTDGMITGGEISTFNAIADEKGFEDFHDIFNEVDREVRSLDDLQGLISRLKGTKKGSDILRYVLDISMADANINAEEIDIIKIAGREWDVDLSSLMGG